MSPGAARRLKTLARCPPCPQVSAAEASRYARELARLREHLLEMEDAVDGKEMEEKARRGALRPAHVIIPRGAAAATLPG